MRDAVRAQVERWAASGCMHLTGPATSPGLGPPAPLIDALDRTAARLAEASASIGSRVSIEPLSLLAARGAIACLGRRGRTSCGGATRLIRCADGWVALALAREDDVASIPALVEGDVDDPWEAVASWCRTRDAAQVVERAILLGLPLAALPRRSPATGTLTVPTQEVRGAPTERASADQLVVVDLSSLWAGPLCGALLARAGCTVIKVESLERPDAARAGPQAFFDLVNAGKLNVALDLRRSDGVGALRRLIANADVVIEASRPRAREHLGLNVEEQLAGRARVWATITGHGMHGSAAERVAFGDDAAVGGGLVVTAGRSGPFFCADAIADPIAGIVAATAVLECLARGGRWHLDVALSRLAGQVSGPTLSVPPTVTARSPRAERPSRRAAALGAHTAWALERA